MINISSINSLQMVINNILQKTEIFNKIQQLKTIAFFSATFESSFPTVNSQKSLLSSRIQDFSLSPKIRKVYKISDVIILSTDASNNVTSYKKQYFLVNTLQTDSPTITITFLDDEKLTITNLFKQFYKYRYVNNTTNDIFIFSKITFTFTSEESFQTLTFTYNNLSISDLKMNTSFSRSSGEFITVSVTMSYREFFIDKTPIIVIK